MKKKLLIIGASGHGKVVADIALSLGKWEEIAFLDDDKSIKKSLGLEVIGTSVKIAGYIDEYDMFVAIGNNEIRKKLYMKLEQLGASIPVLVHPSAVIGKEVTIDKGTVVMAGVVINCSTTIGKGCIINTGATIDHDSEIGEFVHISPGVNIAGTVKIGESSWIGAGGIVINDVNITNNSIVGAGAVVIEDIKDSGTYVGVPARRV